jgi:plasmid maintenance system killer protein
MDIIFLDRKFAKFCNSHKSLVKEYGDRQAKLIGRRLDELRAAEVLEDMRHLPQARCHELKGNRADQLSVDLVHPYRLIFCPSEPVPRKPDGGIDWGRVMTIDIIGVEDTHE